MSPSFIIIGGVKCGTSSLYRYINEHPSVLPCKTKEPQYFNIKWALKRKLKRNWYYAQFPKLDYYGHITANWLELSKDGKMLEDVFSKEKKKGQSYITGEASAAIFASTNPTVIKRELPKVKLILLLRDPSERFQSHYNMFHRFKQGGRQAHKDLVDYLPFVNDEINQFQRGKKTRILRQGVYVELLKKWSAHFDKNQLLILETKSLKMGIDKQVTMDKICKFLKIDSFKFADEINQYNKAHKKILNEDAMHLLNEFYAPFNKRLKEDFNITFD